MTSKHLAIAAALLLAAGTAAAATADKKFDFGKREYDSNCASCHGITGKGDGVLRPWLTKSAPDLTELAKRSGGVFPFNTTWAVIDGRVEFGAHGTRDMPVWGRDYLAQAGDYYASLPYDPVPYDPEAFVRARITALIDYVNRMQAR